MVRSYLLLLFCVTCWGSNFVFGSILIHEFPPFLLSAFRLSMTSLCLFSYAWGTRKLGRPSKGDFKLLIPMGIVGIFCNQVAFFNGLKTVDATTAALITSLAPITIAVLAWMFLKEKITKQMGAGSLIAILGIFFVVGKSDGIQLSIGVLYMFLAMLSFSVSIILMRRLTERIDAFTATVYSTIIGSALVVPTALIKEPVSHASPHLWAWLLLLATAVVMQGLCSLIWNAQLGQVGAGKASIFLNLQPFVAMVLGFLLLGTPVTPTQTTGALLIVGGVILATLQRKEKSGYRKEPADATPKPKPLSKIM